MRPAAAGDAPPAAGGDRLAAIDVGRATAVVLMVVVHFAENLSGWQGGAGGAFRSGRARKEDLIRARQEDLIRSSPR